MIKPPLVTFCSILGLFTVAPAIAGTVKSSSPQSIQGAVDRELVRRQDAVVRSNAAVEAGKAALKAKDYETAVQQFRLAVDIIPVSHTTTEPRNRALKLFSDASIKLAEQRISEGRYADAEAIAKVLLEERYFAENRAAVKLLSQLEQPDYYNKTITPGHHAKVEQVKQYLIEAKGFLDTGRYDKAKVRYEMVLNLDPYNKTARHGIEAVNEQKTDYGRAAYNSTRSEMIQQLQNAWAIAPRRHGFGGVGPIETGPLGVKETAQITSKLDRIVIPRVEFTEASVADAIQYLRNKSRELDVTEPDPNRKGVNIVLQVDPSSGMGAPVSTGIDGLPADGLAVPEVAVVNPDAKITLSLSNVPLAEVLRYITKMANLRVKIDPYAVAIVPLTVLDDQMFTKEYKVPPGFLNKSPMGGGGGAQPPTATWGATPTGGSSIPGRRTAKDYLVENGVDFSKSGASAQFISSSSRLIVRNTQDQLDLIDAIVAAETGAVPVQVEIESKFVEISQNNLKELSFDWLLGQFNIGGQRVFGGGGTSGTGNPVSPTNFPFMNPYTGELVGSNPLTAGNRTGTGLGGAISANAIDALLYPSAGLSSAAPGIFSMAGVFTDPQFQLVIRALDQKKGVDLLSAPRVTTKSGSQAKIEIIREFIYPTEFSPPQIPQTITASTSSGIGGGSVGSIPVTPTTPTSFGSRNTGVTLDVDPTVDSNNTAIDLNLSPEVVEFEGFINYGSPILTPGQTSIIGGLFVSAPPTVITPNVINQPIFSTRRVKTNVVVWDGQTVALGGLMREDVQKVEDKVPILGDLPLVGRAFRSSVDQHLKRNLVIFVTARLINPAGDLFNQTEEEEEDLGTPMIPEQLPIPGDLGLPIFSK